MRRDEHEPDATCALHGKGVCFRAQNYHSCVETNAAKDLPQK